MSPRPPDTLTQEDRAAVLRRIVSDWFIERLDTRLGTADVVKLLKQGHAITWEGTGETSDGPYSDGKNPVYWSLKFTKRPQGYDVKVQKTVRKTNRSTVVRSGRITWNELANRCTHAALELKHRPPDKGEQSRLF